MKNKTFGAISIAWCLLSAIMIWHTKDAKADVVIVSGQASQQVLLASAARTTTQTVKVSSPLGLRCGHVIINVSAYTTGSLTPVIQGYDIAANAYYNILSGVAITAAGRTVLKVCPGITASANVSTADFLPLNWQLVITVGDASSITYSVSAELLP